MYKIEVKLIDNYMYIYIYIYFNLNDYYKLNAISFVSAAKCFQAVDGRYTIISFLYIYYSYENILSVPTRTHDTVYGV